MLVVDVGNTRTRIALFEGEDIVRRIVMNTRDLDIDELTAAFAGFSSGGGGDEVYVASVAPYANALIDSAAERAGFARRFIRPGADRVIDNRLDFPEKTGVDRLLAALAAGRRYFSETSGGYVVVQCGSAATVDVVDRTGVFCGGYILPGPGYWLSGLGEAAQLPDLSAETPDWQETAPGRNTRDAILHGLAASLPGAVLAAVRGLCRRLAEGAVDGETEPGLVFTGGWGAAVAALAGGKSEYNPDLVLHGIRLFMEQTT